MNHDIDSLFRELSELVPEMKNDPESWKAFLSSFIEQQPDSKIDPRFKEQLRQQILSAIGRKQDAALDKGRNWPQWLKWSLGLAGSFAVISFALLPYLRPPSPSSPSLQMTFPESPVTFEEASLSVSAESDAAAQALMNDSAFVQVNDLPPNALGNIAQSNPQAKGVAMGELERGGGGGIPSQGMPYNGARVNISYQYKGKPLSGLPEQTRAYRKKLGASERLNQGISSLIGEAGMGGLDLKRLGQLELRQMLLAQQPSPDKPDEIPYQVNVDFQNRTIWLHPDQEKWQKKFCPNGVCDYAPLLKASIPSDDQIKAIAKNFLDSLGVDLSSTEGAQINKYWLTDLAPGQSPLEPDPYPDTIQVIFPILVEGQTVQEAWGQLVGIGVEVNLRYKNVSSAQIPIMELEASSYPALRADEILESAQKGGYDGVSYANPDQSVTFTLGSPKQELRRIWQYAPEGPKEILVNMMVFPVLDRKESPDYYVPQQVLVPLAKSQ